MNKLIREFEKTSGLDVYGLGAKTVPWEATLERFTELIVRECVAICEDTEGDPSADSRWGRRCCALEIREHFGVE